MRHAADRDPRFAGGRMVILAVVLAWALFLVGGYVALLLFVGD